MPCIIRNSTEGVIKPIKTIYKTQDKVFSRFKVRTETQRYFKNKIKIERKEKRARNKRD